MFNSAEPVTDRPYAMAISRNKIRCRKCKRNYYQVTTGRAFCPYCAKDALVPNGTRAILQLTIQPGGYNDDGLCLEADLATKAQSGAIYLRGLVTVLSGDQKNKKFTIPIEISSSKSDYWQNKGRELIRSILNSSQGLSPSDNSRKAVFSRIIDSYKVLNGIAFVGVVGIKKGRLGRDENTIDRVLSGDNEDYRDWVNRKIFVPAQKFPPPSKPSSAMWRRA